ncbi:MULTISPECIES: CaiB/BaiF CoA-transferase family protein [unclassified Variovorax]|uniref:CaiB/BaiF CoA transferase family protein n=1 Tax=unclassified Variovorax TaxID=663243 RepID=UPI0008B25826|nr:MULTISPECIES: CoA transferase [unclassified Variovorax]SEK16155.1 formyl-CoA transferase/CoA:oxalate CoA-transferase [Variovorax sp. OK202]SFE35475.1 formyl-CoA transferase/CoA:oxalate CoA-transferase [Variovorax sp. OK212]
MSGQRKPRLPLSGYRVLDLTVMTAGPVGTMMLGDVGADVIKIEELRDGELSRSMGTLYVGDESVNFLSQNRNKRSVRLDLKKPEGREAFLRMVRAADVITENFRPGTMDRLGIGYEAVRAVNPRIVFASISAFGQDGPYAHLPANDPIIQALSGLMHMTGDADGEPVRVGHPYPDFGAAALMAFGICAALLHREHTGEGQRLDLSLLNGTIFSAIPRDGETLRTGKAPPRLGSGHPSFVPYRNYKGSDGALFFLSCFNEKFWAAVCDAIERPDLKTEPRTATNVARCANRAFVDAELQAVFAQRPLAEWLTRFEEYNVPAAPVHDLHHALRNDPQCRHNNTVIEVEHATAGTVEMLALPVNFHGTPARYERAAPVLGAHSIEVLREFGFAPGEIDALLACGAVAGEREPTLS